MKFLLSTFLFFLLSLGFSLTLSAQWEVKLLNTLELSSNTQLIFIPLEERTAEQDLKIEFSFWTKENRRLLYKRELEINSTLLQSEGLKCKLPAGDYEVLLSIQSAGLFQDFQLNHSVYSWGNTLAASDIILTLEGEEQATLPSFQAGDQNVEFRIFYQSKARKELTIRAVLYFDESGAKQNSTLAYASVAQQNQILRFSRKKATGSGIFSLKDLKEGKYLIEILPYEDDKLLGKWVRSAHFKIEWPELLRLKSQSAQAIKMMKYILPPEEISALLNIEKDKQFEALEASWKQRYSKNSQAKMQQYFKKIFQAEKQFAEGDTPGWQTDRASIFVRYGLAPQQRFERIAERDYLRWMYPDWSLSFLFEKRKQSWYLIE